MHKTRNVAFNRHSVITAGSFGVDKVVSVPDSSLVSADWITSVSAFVLQFLALPGVAVTLASSDKTGETCSPLTLSWLEKTENYVMPCPSPLCRSGVSPSEDRRKRNDPGQDFWSQKAESGP